MTDIVKRLQALGRCEHDDFSLGFEAADEVARLRQRVAELEALHTAHVEREAEHSRKRKALQLEIAALKAGQGAPVAWLRKETKIVDGLWEDELILNFNGDGIPLYAYAKP